MYKLHVFFIAWVDFPFRYCIPTFTLLPSEERGMVANSDTGQAIQARHYSPHLCVGFLFLILYNPPPPLHPPLLLRRPLFTHHLSHNFVTHHLSHTPSFAHTLLSQLCHPPSFTHNFVTHPSFTHNFVTHHLSHTTLSHTIFHTQLCHTPSFTPCVCALLGLCRATYGHLSTRWWVEALASFSCVSLYIIFLTHTCVTHIFHTQLYHTHNSSHTTFFNLSILHHLLCLSFLPRPATTFVSHYWKKLTCGVIRSFFFPGMVSRPSYVTRHKFYAPMYLKMPCLGWSLYSSLNCNRLWYPSLVPWSDFFKWLRR